MRDTTTTLVAPAACQGGTAECPSSKVRLARGLRAPSGEVRLTRGLNTPSGEVRSLEALTIVDPRAGSASLEGSTPPPPRARSASLEGTCTHDVHAPAPMYGHLML
jgi:hypothetical protein